MELEPGTITEITGDLGGAGHGLAPGSRVVVLALRDTPFEGKDLYYVWDIAKQSLRWVVLMDLVVVATPQYRPDPDDEVRSLLGVKSSS